ncbi:YtxH domain-containing protein [Jeotgalibacillus sp. S-D1]|uniref:YtxH domain-containing protein n=1 Tax=Jeotgalibacillus sp. S-D1 TaxID=2552189 RepID=UPI00105A3870|nr:YtxH domain-containing protein [Jeotgalibacillus sp. S-D1]TDL34285.1 YtxH domain-containing protein [Jeotgalibacillus sp. S-D1]
MTQFEKPTAHKEEKETNSKDFVVGALIGGAIGAATALFLAPKSGTELRQDLNTQTNLLKERSSEWKDQAVTKGNELAATAKEKSAGITQTVQSQSNAIVEKVKSLKGNSSESSEESSDNINSDLTKFSNESNQNPAPSVTPVDPLTPNTSTDPIGSSDKKL